MTTEAYLKHHNLDCACPTAAIINTPALYPGHIHLKISSEIFPVVGKTVVVSSLFPEL